MASDHHLFEIEATVLSPTRPTISFGSTVCPSWSFCIGGYDWECNYNADHNAGTVSITLSLPYGNVREPLNARFKFSLLDREGRPAPSRTRASSFHNWSTQQRWEWPCANFITRKDLERPELLKDGSFTVRCDIALKAFTDKGDDGFVRVPPSDLHQHLGSLLGSKEGADVTFVVADGEMFAAHRCVLAARSPVFRAQLFGQMKESKLMTTGGGDGGGGAIEIDDMEARVFSSLLHFIYTDSLLFEENTDSLLPEVVEKKGKEDDDDNDGERMVLYQHLLVAADRYGLERMKLICQEKLCGYICPKSVARMLVLADRHHCPGLKEACFDFLSSSTNLENFTETDGFEVLTDSCPAVLKELLAKLSTVLIFD